MAVLAGSLGVYAVLAVVFHWLVEPVIITLRSRLPTETLVAYGNRPSEEPATSGHSLRGAAQASFEKTEPPRPADGLAATSAGEADIKAPDMPKQESHRNATRRAGDRPTQRSAERRGSSWSFSSSPASPNYR